MNVRLWHKYFPVNFVKYLTTHFLTEHLRVTASDIRMQVVVIYNLNLSLQFLTLNFTLLCEFSRWLILQCCLIMLQTSICFSVRLFLAMTARQLLRKNNNKYNI